MRLLPTERTINTTAYTFFSVAAAASAWFSGERVLYVAAAALFLLPALSYTITFAMLRGLRVKQIVPRTLVKEEMATLKVRLHNITPIPFSAVECIFYADEYAIGMDELEPITLGPLSPTVLEARVMAYYRGEYELGVQAIKVKDISGFFTLTRKFNKKTMATAYPKIVSFSDISLAKGLLSQAHSRFDIADEDYATISDIRPYVPTDSIKRVHWKLTAKRNEWLVKVFQANARSQVTMILDTLQIQGDALSKLSFEDSIIENAISMVKFCLESGMPVDFMVTDGTESKMRHPQEFNALYKHSAKIKFEATTKLTPLAILTKTLNDAVGFVNATIFTSKISNELSEKIVTAAGKGHYIVMIYFATGDNAQDAESLKQYKLLQQSNIDCYVVEEAGDE